MDDMFAIYQIDLYLGNKVLQLQLISYIIPLDDHQKQKFIIKNRVNLHYQEFRYILNISFNPFLKGRLKILNL